MLRRLATLLGGGLTLVIGALFVVMIMVVMAVAGNHKDQTGSFTANASSSGVPTCRVRSDDTAVQATNSTSGTRAKEIAALPPEDLLPIYQRAADRYHLGEQGWSVLAAINRIETRFGKYVQSSPKGAIGWMQFMPATWAAYGVDGDGDGYVNPDDPDDAIFSAANYLQQTGAPGNWPKAVFAYNHADWYVKDILDHADAYRGACRASGPSEVLGGGDIVAIQASDPWLATVPGTTVQCDRRIVDNVAYLLRRFDLGLGSCYAPTGHKSNGEHPLGLAIDVWPRDGNWDHTMGAARFVGWNESCAARGCPNAMARWIGYNGVADHGDPEHCKRPCPPHLHISWNHSETPYNSQAATVQVWNLSLNQTSSSDPQDGTRGLPDDSSPDPSL